MIEHLRSDLSERFEDMRTRGVYKRESIILSSQNVHVQVEGRGELLNMCANNYLGLANHPELISAAHDALDRWGYGMASVRFICGTQELHRQLEDRLTGYLGTEDTALFGSCFDANGGLFEALLDERDVVISDELNHASIIDGIRLCKAQRRRYANGDLGELEEHLVETEHLRYRLIATDGVFSMDGHLARLDKICDLADQYDALVMVDDSHGAGVVGLTGRGTPELLNVTGRIDILTGTLGKAFGGASGGYISGRAEVVELMRQRARPYLFSNSVPPPVVAASIRALELGEQLVELKHRLDANTAYFRERMCSSGFNVIEGTHPIVPVVIGDEQRASLLSNALLDQGVYAVSFSYPVVPKGTARIRTQVSAAHSRLDLERAVTAFCAAEHIVRVHASAAS